ncbi:hypothetical protein WG947_16320 [Pontibacter sp. H259]|uniref:hypothetical protein n=1 Tax=Pontibacter sp. H259 TaxID=3133421 RepID=UPI0030C1A89A
MTLSTSIKVQLKYKLLFVFALLAFTQATAQDVFSVGPALHFNFGDKKPKVSWGIEASVWWFEDYNVPFSANLGFDRRNGSTILYTQAQTGVGVLGVSAGPFIEFKPNASPIIGLQTDYWANYYLGLNYRVRFGSDGTQKALGLYLKAPIMLGPEEENEGDDDWDWD